MIARLEGMVVQKGRGYITIDVSGVGYKVYVTTNTLLESTESDPITVWTYLSVRDTALDLFGFLTEEERSMFELLISVSGIGPKSALAILGIADTNTLTSAISTGDSSYLTSVSGIGKKSAEKIVLELSDKIGATADSALTQEDKGDIEVIEALIALGYGIKEAREALKAVPKESTTTSARLKEALKALSNS